MTLLGATDLWFEEEEEVGGRCESHYLATEDAKFNQTRSPTGYLSSSKPKVLSRFSNEVAPVQSEFISRLSQSITSWGVWYKTSIYGCRYVRKECMHEGLFIPFILRDSSGAKEHGVVSSTRLGLQKKRLNCQNTALFSEAICAQTYPEAIKAAHLHYCPGRVLCLIREPWFHKGKEQQFPGMVN